MNPQQIAFDLDAALADVADQRQLDRLGADAVGRPGSPTGGASRPGSASVARRPSLAYVKTRMAALLQAHAAQPGEEYALRQAYIDLAAICEEAAATLPRPDAPAAAGPLCSKDPNGDSA